MQIWRADTGALVQTLRVGHTCCVFSVAYSPDGLYIVSGSEAETIKACSISKFDVLYGGRDGCVCLVCAVECGKICVTVAGTRHMW